WRSGILPLAETECAGLSMAASSAAAYIRVQASVAAMVNVVINPAIDWLSSRHKAAQPVWGADGLVTNFVVTSLILSLLVAVFTGYGVRREVRAGRIALHDGSVSAPRWLNRLTARPWLLGLMFGAAGSALTVVSFWLLHSFGVSTLSLGWLMVIKAAYCGVLAFVVARWVILRQLAVAVVPK